MNKAELVKELRRITDAGMSDCIKALNESENDIDKAIEWLRKNGAVKAAKKADAIAAEGVVEAFTDSKDFVAIMEVNCQTDFVAKNEKFVNFLNGIKKSVLANKTAGIEELKIDGTPVSEIAFELTATIGEKINLRRLETLTASKGQSIGYYTHMNNRVASAILVDGECDEIVLKNVCMHIAAMSPKYLSIDDVDTTYLESERKFMAEQFKQELAALTNEKEKEQKAKREEIIVEGKVKKLLDEICLLNQKFVIDNSITVAQYLEKNKVKAVKMINVILGEGIEKKEVSFAEEVAQQMKN